MCPLLHQRDTQSDAPPAPLLVWLLTPSLTGMAEPAGIALEIIGARKPPHHDKVAAPPGGDILNLLWRLP
ncbi:unnamed protein product [Danaus chrysippus]|uniref:(African queen) hypothetical protein n=1 Tax=Danaus chrysippus TaxID=151541 RepID=A0A8J2VU34_9NEOP|nr:unnamed protein product [Danaus chrysippus]